MTEQNNKDNIMRKIKQNMLDKLETIGKFVESEAISRISGHRGKELKAVDTGNLMGSIAHKVDEKELSVRIGTNVEYAPYVELGTYKMGARPFLRLSLLENKSQINKIFQK